MAKHEVVVLRARVEELETSLDRERRASSELHADNLRLSTIAAEVTMITAERDQYLGELKAANLRIEELEANQRIAEEEMEAAEGSQGSASGLTAGMAELG
jgi:chromosome segregation ATPase